jgi:hypothetical protein
MRPQSPDHHRVEAAAARSTSAGSRALSPPGRPFPEASSHPSSKAPPPAVAPKKDVTSKIASLWKKVEESKQKQQQQQMGKKDGTKDKRVWISRGGKPQQQEQREEGPPPSPTPPAGRLIRSGTYEKLNTDQLTTSVVPLTTNKELKPRSRSRLSIKLSKFGLSKKKEDTANGNSAQSAGSPDTDELGNSYPALSSPGSNVDSPTDNIGELADCVAIVASHEQRTAAHPFRSSSSASSSRGSLAAAVVAPFNYTPSSSTAAAHDVERIKSAAQIKRNSSYVSSMGRKREEGGDVSPAEEPEPHHLLQSGEERRARKTMTSSGQLTLGAYTGNTSSSVVTLV